MPPPPSGSSNSEAYNMEKQKYGGKWIVRRNEEKLIRDSRMEDKREGPQSITKGIKVLKLE